MADKFPIVFTGDDEYQRALIREAAARLQLEVVDAGGGSRAFTVFVSSHLEAWRFGIETGDLRAGSQR